jgi:menaquinone-9 beta-reductase
VARLVSAPTSHAANHSVATVYTYLPGIPAEGYEWYFDHQKAAGLIPTNDGEVCVFVSTPPDRFRNELRRDVPAGFATVLAETAPDLAELVAASPVSPRFRAWEGMHGYLRMPYGPGWALVGDAGYFKDPITAHGITDAFRDAELLVAAIVAAAGGIPEVAAFGAYEEVRDRMSLPLFHATDEVASFRWHTGGLMDTLMQVSRAMSAEGEMLAGLHATALAA